MYAMNPAMTIHATMNETSVPMPISMSCWLSGWFSLTYFSILYPQAANMAGIARKKLNSVAAGRETPQARADMIVAADRLVPGNVAARIWQMPMMIAWESEMFSIRSALMR